MIKLNGEKLRQYDLNRTVVIIPRSGHTLDDVLFFKNSPKPLVVASREEDGKIVADIPNVFLKTFGVLTVECQYTDAAGYQYTERQSFTIEKRAMPEGYTYEETDTLDLGKGGGGASHWDDLEGKPFGDRVERTNLYSANMEGAIADFWPDGYAGYFVIEGLNLNKKYNFVIRGDVYENVGVEEILDYYHYFVWGSYGNYSTDGKYPFCYGVYDGNSDSPSFDGNGNYIGDYDPQGFNGIVFCVNRTRYPDLDFATEVQIYDSAEPDLTPIPKELLPEPLRFGERIVDIVPEQTMPASPGDRVEFVKPLVEGVEYVVAVDGVEEIAVAKSAYSGEYIYLGNLGINMPTTYTDEEFFVFYNSLGNFMVAGQSSNVEGEHTIAVYQHDVKTLDSKYLPPTVIDFHAVAVEDDGQFYIQCSVDMTADELQKAANHPNLNAKVFEEVLPLVGVHEADSGIELLFRAESVSDGYVVFAYLWTQEDGTVGSEVYSDNLTIPKIASFHFEEGKTNYWDANESGLGSQINSISVEFMDGENRINDVYSIVDAYDWAGAKNSHPVYQNCYYLYGMAIKQENNYNPTRNPHLGMLQLLFDRNTDLFYRAFFIPNKHFYLSSSTEGSTKQFKITVDDSGNLTATEITE